MRLLLAFLLAFGPAGRASATVAPGATPGSINYQGRLENAGVPITGTVPVEFTLFDTLAGGTGSVLWTSGVLNVPVLAGVFGTAITVPQNVLAATGTKYLEVKALGQILSPRESLKAVPYALIAKDLEERNLTLDSVLLFNVTTGAESLIRNLNATKSVVVTGSDGETTAASVRLMGNSAAVAANQGDLYLSIGKSTAELAVRVAPGLGEVMRVQGDGRVAIGTSVPADANAKLTVKGDVWVGHESDGAESLATADEDLFVKGNLVVDGHIVQHEGEITSAFDALGIGGVAVSGELLRVGSTPNLVVLSGASGNVGIGTASPAERLEITGASADGIRLRGASPAYGITATAGDRAELGVASTAGAYSSDASVGDAVLRARDGDLILQSGTGASALLIETSNEVGIGVVNPSHILDVADRIQLREGSASAGIDFFQTTPAAARAFMGMKSDDEVGFFGRGNNLWAFWIDVNSSIAFTRSMMNVGGTDLILGMLDGRDQGTVLNQRALVHCDTAGCGSAWANDTLGINFAGDYEGGVKVEGLGLFVDPGRIGIGTITPAVPLHIRTAGAGQQVQALLEDSTGTRPMLKFSEGSSFGMSIEYDGTGTGTSNKLKFNSDTNAPWMTLQNDGALGIGTDTPAATLDVVGEARVSGVSGDGTGKVVCIKSDGNLGTCVAFTIGSSGCTCN